MPASCFLVAERMAMFGHLARRLGTGKVQLRHRPTYERSVVIDECFTCSASATSPKVAAGAVQFGIVLSERPCPALPGRATRTVNAAYRGEREMGRRHSRGPMS